MQEITGSAGGWAGVRPIQSEEFPLPAQRPRYPITSKDKLKRVFDVEMPDWQTQLRSFLAEVAGSGGRDSRHRI
ncbi:RmlD substrate binding domain protein [compost metagenome]